MIPDSNNIEDIERSLMEGRLGEVESIPPYVGPLPKTPRLHPDGSLIAYFPNEINRHARVCARIKRALRDTERPNPYRAHREIKPDPEFVARNVSYSVFRALGIKCSFQWPVAPHFHRHLVVVPTCEGASSQLAREHIYRSDRRIWSLAIYPLWDIREKLRVAEFQLWRNARETKLRDDPWRTHAAVVSASIIPAHPHGCFCLNGWANIEDLALGNQVEREYDSVDSKGWAQIGKLACRQIPHTSFRPMIELLPLLDGWDLTRLKSENRIDVSDGVGKA